MVLETLLTFLGSMLGVWAFRRHFSGRLLDVPNERSSHARPTPRGAGIVILVVIAVAVAMGAARGQYPATLRGFTVACAAGAVTFISGVDDLRGVPSGIRLCVHIASALFAVAALWSAVPVPHWTFWCGALVLVVGLTNAYNFMDGIDGIAATQAIVGGLAFSAAGLLYDEPPVVWAALALVGASAGFLVHNWAPAGVFMGDVGSAPVGFLFGIFTVDLWHVSAQASIGALFALWPFLFDTTFTIMRRVRRGENVFSSHRSHLYQRLTTSGWSHAHVTVLYATLATLGAAAGLGFGLLHWRKWTSVLISALAFGLWLFVCKAERYERARRSGTALRSR